MSRVSPGSPPRQPPGEEWAKPWPLALVPRTALHHALPLCLAFPSSVQP